MVKKQKLSLLCISLISLASAFATDANARLNTWANYYSPTSKNPGFNTYIGFRVYSSMFSSDALENKLKGKSIEKRFYREWCADPDDDTAPLFLCNNIYTEMPTDGSYEVAVSSLDMSNEQFTTKELDFQLPGFSATIGTSIGNGLRMELEVGTFSSSSSSGGLFSTVFNANKNGELNGLIGTGSNELTQAQLNAAGNVNIDIGFNAELEKKSVGLNLIYDIDIGELKPFVGVGFAYTAYTTVLNLNGSDEDVNTSLFGGVFVDGTSFVTAENKFDKLTYSLIGGFSYPLSDMITAEIGYKQTFGGTLDWALVAGDADGAGSKQSIMSVKDSQFKELFFGLKMNF